MGVRVLPIVSGRRDGRRIPGRASGRQRPQLFGRSGNGYRIDHIFITKQNAAQVRYCGYLHAPRNQGLADHAAMTLTLMLSARYD